jgi:hypothetical protein
MTSVSGVIFLKTDFSTKKILWVQHTLCSVIDFAVETLELLEIERGMGSD